MKLRTVLLGLLSGGLLVSCQSHKSGGDDALADNGGYSEGGFYGDNSAPAPPGYPQDGETFATDGGVPFSHHDRVETVAVSDPVVEPERPAPVPTRRAVAAAPAADPYATAYAGGGSYASDHSSEVADVTPYVERPQPVEPATPSAPPKSKTATTKSSASGSKKAVVSTPTKKTKVVASSKKSGSGAAKVSGKASGTAVKAVYTPPGKSKSTAKKKATVARVHEVKRGDTLSKLASRYGVSVAQLKKRNKLASDTIVVGKRLSID